MPGICQEAHNFLCACEVIQKLVALGGILAPVDKDLIEFCALDLLSKLKPA